MAELINLNKARKAKAKVDLLQAKRWVMVLEKLKKTLEGTTWKQASNANGSTSGYANLVFPAPLSSVPAFKETGLIMP